MKIRTLSLACVTTAAVLLAGCTAFYKNTSACEQMMRSKLADVSPEQFPEASIDKLSVDHTGTGIHGTRVVVEASLSHMQTASEVAAASAPKGASGVAAASDATADSAATASAADHEHRGRRRLGPLSRFRGRAGHGARGCLGGFRYRGNCKTGQTQESGEGRGCRMHLHGVESGVVPLAGAGRARQDQRGRRKRQHGVNAAALGVAFCGMDFAAPYFSAAMLRRPAVHHQ